MSQMGTIRYIFNEPAKALENGSNPRAIIVIRINKL
jgi:hypothetical protein